MKKDQREKIQVMTYNWGPCLIKLKVADEFIKRCKETVYSSNENTLLPLAKKINSKFTLLYKTL